MKSTKGKRSHAKKSVDNSKKTSRQSNSKSDQLKSDKKNNADKSVRKVRARSKRASITSLTRADTARTVRQYRIAKIERYYGKMKAYVFTAKNNKKEFSPIFSDKNIADFERLFESVKEKALAAPLRYTQIKIQKLAVKGVAEVTNKEGEQTFKFWKASVKSIPKCNKKVFYKTLIERKESLKRKLEDFATEGEKMEYAGNDSNTAERYYLEAMKLYAELPKGKKSTTNKKVKRKKKKSKNRSR